MQQERTFECPVCGMDVTIRYFRAHYRAHFETDIIERADLRSSEAIKEEQASASSFVATTLTSAELQTRK